MIATRGPRSTSHDLVETLVAVRVPPRVPGRAPGRGRGARLDRRRVPVDRRRPGPHRPVGRRGRPARRVLGRRPAGRPTTSTASRSSRAASCCRPTRCASAPRRWSPAHPWGREQWQRLADGEMFDGMEAWLPGWRSASTAASTCCSTWSPGDGQILLVEPRRLRTPGGRRSWPRRSTSAPGAGRHLGPRRRSRAAPAARRLRPPARPTPARRPGPSPRCPTRRDSPAVSAAGWPPAVGEGEALLSPAARAGRPTGYRIVVCADGAGSAERIDKLLREHGRQYPVLSTQRRGRPDPKALLAPAARSSWPRSTGA